MSALEQAVVGPAIEVVAKATRRRFTVEYKRKIVREADACKVPGAIRGVAAAGGVVLLVDRGVAEAAGPGCARGPGRAGGSAAG